MTIKTKCVTNIKEALGDKVTRKQVDEIVDEVLGMAERDPALTRSFAQKLKLAAREISEADLIEAATMKRQRAINIMRDKQGWERISTSRRKMSAELHAQAVGAVDAELHAGTSVDAQAHTLEGGWVGGLIVDLSKAKVLHRVTGKGLLRRRDPDFERAVAIEMGRLNGGPDGPTGNHEAVKIAEIFNKYGEAARQSLNKAGAFIGKVKGFVISQTHDQAKISSVSYEAWRDVIAPLLDESTFTGVRDRDAFLRAVYINLATGNHLKTAKGFSGDFKYTGTKNLAKMLSHSRKLQFKSAGDWFTYNERFGLGNVYDGMLFNLRRAARDTATMNTYGVNPQQMFERWVKKAIVQAKADGDVKEVARLETGLTPKAGMTPGLFNEFEAAIGMADVPGNPSWAQVWQATRAVVSMAKLGGMVLSSLPDLGTRASVLRNNGVNLLEGLGNGFHSLFKGRGSAEWMEAALLSGVGWDGMLGSTLARFTSVDNVPGRMSKMMGHFFRLNLASWWQDSLMIGMSNMLSHNLARNAAKGFDALPLRLRQTLNRYGIDGAVWDKLRSSGARTVEGRAMLFADDVLDADAAQKLRLYYVDQSRLGLTMGGAAEHAWVTQFGAPGSLSGEIARFALQFKNYPLTFARRHFGGAVKRGDYGGIATLIVLTTMLGYLSRSAKDIAAGREPRNPVGEEWAGAWGEALTQGGGLGIYGDFLLGEYDRFGRTLGETAMGPTVSLASNWLGIFRSIATGGLFGEDAADIGARLVKTTVDTMPFMNLFYTRTALDYLVLFQVQEMLDPGALRRREKKMASERGQRYIMPPSSAIPYGGGARIFEGVR